MNRTFLTYPLIRANAHKSSLSLRSDSVPTRSLIVIRLVSRASFHLDRFAIPVSVSPLHFIKMPNFFVKKYLQMIIVVLLYKQ